MTADLVWAREHTPWHYQQWHVHVFNRRQMQNLLHDLRYGHLLKSTTAADFRKLVDDIKQETAAAARTLDCIVAAKDFALKQSPALRHIDIDMLPRQTLRAYLGHSESRNDCDQERRKRQQQFWMLVFFLMILLHLRHNSFLMLVSL